jgi:ethanolamine utilization protein EutP (predicted NTPase)
LTNNLVWYIILVRGDLIVESLTTIKGGVYLFEKGLEISNKYGLSDKIARFVKGQKQIILLGETGTGKSALLNSLTGENTHGRIKTVAVQSVEMKSDKTYIKVYDTPGHVSYEENRKELLRKMDTRGNKIGIINVVCYGYHYRDDKDPDMSLNQFFEENRKREIEQLKEINGYHYLTKGLKWVLTVVTKADLWYNEKDAVMKYYKSNDYSKSIHVQHEIVPYCSKIVPAFGLPTQLSEDDKDSVNSEFLSYFSQFVHAEIGI